MSAIQDAIDLLLPDNTTGAISPEDLRNAFEQVTTVPESAMAKESSTLTGFDREDMDTGGKSLGILQYCHLATSTDIHQVDEDGVYSLLTGESTFADGTALANRTLMQYHATGETNFTYWRQGELVTVTTAKFIQLAADYKGYIGYNAAGELDDTVTDVKALIVRTPLVVYMYLNGTEGEFIWYADERHGIVMDGQTHLQQHMTSGFQIINGVEISGIANNITYFTSVSAGRGGDEDIQMNFSEITTMPKMYKEGAAAEWRLTDDDNNLGIFRDSKCCYNLDTAGTWSLEEINSDYVIMMPLASNNLLAPVAMMVGQTLHANRGEARDHMPAEYYRIDNEGLPSHEMHPVASMIIHNEGTGQIETGTDGEIYTTCAQGFPIGIFT